MTNIFERAKLTKFQFNEFSEEEVNTFLQATDAEKWTILQPHLFEKKTDSKEFTFLGIRYQLRPQGNLKQISTKTANKLQAVRDIIAKDTILPQASFRQIAMLVGLIRYCSKILEFHNEDFDAYDSLRDMSELCQKDILTWDKQIGFQRAQALKPLAQIAQKILHAQPIRVRPRSYWNNDHAIFLFVDASSIGWGGIALYPTKETKIVKGRWLHPERWKSSVRAEPRAVIEILEALQIPPETEVVIATDHDGLVWASQAVQIHTYYYHEAVKYIQDKKINAIFSFIKGAQNPADEPSRDRPSTASLHEIISLGAAAGAGVAWALQFPSSHRTPNLLVMCGE